MPATPFEDFANNRQRVEERHAGDPLGRNRHRRANARRCGPRHSWHNAQNSSVSRVKETHVYNRTVAHKRSSLGHAPRHSWENGHSPRGPRRRLEPFCRSCRHPISALAIPPPFKPPDQFLYTFLAFLGQLSKGNLKHPRTERPASHLQEIPKLQAIPAEAHAQAKRGHFTFDRTPRSSLTSLLNT